MNKRDVEKVSKALSECSAIQRRIAADRDKLRTKIEELESIADSVDMFCEEFESSHREMQCSLDTLSFYL